ncbi:MAG: TonB-dependent receptor [Asticcacaulis sp.]
MVGDYPNPDDFGAISPYIDAINQLVAAQVDAANGTTPGVPRTFTAWLPKLGLKYDFTPNMSLGFTAQRGYRSGGSSINIARSIVVPYDPEYTDNYEFSWRSARPDIGLTLNANAYYINWTEQQVNVNLGLNSYDNQTVNAGKSHSTGSRSRPRRRSAVTSTGMPRSAIRIRASTTSSSRPARPSSICRARSSPTRRSGACRRARPGVSTTASLPI